MSRPFLLSLLIVIVSWAGPTFADTPVVEIEIRDHLFYPPGTRIITFSSKRPGVLFYKEIEPFTVQFL